jgi:hypothetical protein
LPLSIRASLPSSPDFAHSVTQLLNGGGNTDIYTERTHPLSVGLHQTIGASLVLPDGFCSIADLSAIPYKIERLGNPPNAALCMYQKSLGSTLLTLSETFGQATTSVFPTSHENQRDFDAAHQINLPDV